MEFKSGVTDEQLMNKWMPEMPTRDSYPASATIVRAVANPSQVLAVFDIDENQRSSEKYLPDLVRPDSEARMAKIVESAAMTEVFAITEQFGTSVTP